MNLIEAGDKYRLCWFDESKTILLLQVKRGWKWDDAYTALLAINREIADVGHSVYSVYEFELGAGQMPNAYAIPKLKALLQKEVSNEELIILVGAQSAILSFIEIIVKIYNDLLRNYGKLRSVNTMDEALDLINQHKQSQ